MEYVAFKMQQVSLETYKEKRVTGNSRGKCGTDLSHVYYFCPLQPIDTSNASVIYDIVPFCSHLCPHAMYGTKKQDEDCVMLSEIFY